jgi:hypothetical protein
VVAASRTKTSRHVVATLAVRVTPSSPLLTARAPPLPLTRGFRVRWRGGARSERRGVDLRGDIRWNERGDGFWSAEAKFPELQGFRVATAEPVDDALISSHLEAWLSRHQKAVENAPRLLVEFELEPTHELFS